MIFKSMFLVNLFLNPFNHVSWIKLLWLSGCGLSAWKN